MPFEFTYPLRATRCPSTHRFTTHTIPIELAYSPPTPRYLLNSPIYHPHLDTYQILLSTTRHTIPIELTYPSPTTRYLSNSPIHHPQRRDTYLTHLSTGYYPPSTTYSSIPIKLIYPPPTTRYSGTTTKIFFKLKKTIGSQLV